MIAIKIKLLPTKDDFETQVKYSGACNKEKKKVKVKFKRNSKLTLDILRFGIRKKKEKKIKLFNKTHFRNNNIL